MEAGRGRLTTQPTAATSPRFWSSISVMPPLGVMRTELFHRGPTGGVSRRQWRGFQRARGAGGGGGGGGGGWREPDRGAVRQIQGHCHRGEPRTLVTTVPRPPAVMALFRGRLQMPLSEFGPALRRTRWGSGRGTAQPVAAPSPRVWGSISGMPALGVIPTKMPHRAPSGAISSRKWRLFRLR